MSNKGGFQHNNVYRIISMKDKNVMELPTVSKYFPHEIPTMPLIVNKWNNGQNQKFKTVQLKVGEFRISPILKSGDCGQALDFQASNPGLFLNVWTGVPNQCFRAEEIFPKSKICLIKSPNDGRCFRNMGSGKQIALVPENGGDVSTHWKLETTY